jgi:methionine-rich copper-binding protein CopC
VDSEPPDGAEVHEAPDEVSITFSEPLDASSEIKIFDECDRRLDDGNTQIDLNPTTMRVGIALQPSGHYEVKYEATGVGGVTGTTTGAFHFVVHAGQGCDGDRHHHDDDDDHDGKHDDHDGKQDGKHEDHDGKDDDHVDHDGGDDHSTHPTTTDHGDHGDGTHDDHAAGPQDGGGGPSDKKDEGPTTFTRGESPFPKLEPDDWALYVALGLAVALGAGGGVFLRATGN